MSFPFVAKLVRSHSLKVTSHRDDRDAPKLRDTAPLAAATTVQARLKKLTSRPLRSSAAFAEPVPPLPSPPMSSKTSRSSNVFNAPGAGTCLHTSHPCRSFPDEVF